MQIIKIDGNYYYSTEEYYETSNSLFCTIKILDLDGNIFAESPQFRWFNGSEYKLFYRSNKIYFVFSGRQYYYGGDLNFFPALSGTDYLSDHFLISISIIDLFDHSTFTQTIPIESISNFDATMTDNQIRIFTLSSSGTIMNIFDHFDNYVQKSGSFLLGRVPCQRVQAAAFDRAAVITGGLLILYSIDTFLNRINKTAEFLEDNIIGFDFLGRDLFFSTQERVFLGSSWISEPGVKKMRVVLGSQAFLTEAGLKVENEKDFKIIENVDEFESADNLIIWKIGENYFTSFLKKPATPRIIEPASNEIYVAGPKNFIMVMDEIEEPTHVAIKIRSGGETEIHDTATDTSGWYINHSGDQTTWDPFPEEGLTPDDVGKQIKFETTI